MTGRAMVIFDGLDELLETSDRVDIRERLNVSLISIPLFQFWSPPVRWDTNRRRSIRTNSKYLD